MNETTTYIGYHHNAHCILHQTCRKSRIYAQYANVLTPPLLPRGLRQVKSALSASLHYRLHTAYYTLHTAHCTLHATHCTLHTTYCTLHTTHYTLHTAHCTVHSIQCDDPVGKSASCHRRVARDNSWEDVGRNVHCTLYTVHCTLYTIHCTQYTVHCTMYNKVLYFQYQFCGTFSSGRNEIQLTQLKC